jgi:hypothetical protein
MQGSAKSPRVVFWLARGKRALMTEQINKISTFFARGIGLDAIAAVHVLAAIVVGVLVVRLWNPGDYREALPWVLLAILLLASARGLCLQEFSSSSGCSVFPRMVLTGDDGVGHC